MPDGAAAAELREKAEALKSSADAALRHASQEAQRLEAEAARREHEEEGRRIAAGHRAEIRKLKQEAKLIKAGLQAVSGDLAQAQERAERQTARMTAVARKRQDLEAARDRLLADPSVPVESFDRVTQDLLRLIYLEPFLPPAVAAEERRVEILLEKRSQVQTRLKAVEHQIDGRQEAADDPFGEKREREQRALERERRAREYRLQQQQSVDAFNAEQEQSERIEQGTDGHWYRRRARLASDGTIHFDQIPA